MSGTDETQLLLRGTAPDTLDHLSFSSSCGNAVIRPAPEMFPEESKYATLGIARHLAGLKAHL